MRTTVDLTPAAAARVRRLAAQRSETLGAIASELILRGREPGGTPRVRNGMPLLPVEAPANGQRATPDLELVNRLRDGGP